MTLYRYEDFSPSQFEQLVVLISRKLFGIGVQSFTQGPDGGRDAKFHGTAEIFPSKNSPWQGITIIQAKHASGYNTSFSDSSFFKAEVKSCLINEELPRIKKLFNNKDLNNYILFSNRALTGEAGTRITNYISQQVGISNTNIHLVGLNDIDFYLQEYKDIVDQLNLRAGETLISINPSDLAELIEHMAESLPHITKQITDSPVKRTSYETKNKINNMSAPFAKLLRKNFISEHSVITNYLTNPANESYRDLYVQIVDDFQRQVIAKRYHFNNFDEVYNYLIQMIIERSPYIRQRENQKLMKAMLFYMYFNCDLGESEDADTD